MAALGILALKVLGIVGGLTAIVIGLTWLIFGLIASTSSHVGSAATLTTAGSAVFILFGLLSIYSTVVYDKKPMLSSKLLISSGILGFFAGYAADYPITQGFLGLISWIVPGSLMIVAGLIGWIRPERLAISLPLLNSDRGEARLAAKVLYGGALIVIIVMMMGFLSMTGILLLGLQEDSRSDDALFSEATMHESYGAYDSALHVYDRIIARNQSNAEAWMGRCYALNKMGMHSEANESCARARELEDLKHRGPLP